MTILTVCKFTGRKALDCLIYDYNATPLPISTSILGPICNVYRLYVTHHTVGDLKNLNPVSMRPSYGLSLPADAIFPRLRKLTLRDDAYMDFARFTSITSLNLDDVHAKARSLTILTQLRKIRMQQVNNIEGIALESITLYHVDFPLITCTSLRRLHVYDIVTPPTLGQKISLDILIFRGSNLPSAYINNTRSLTRLQLHNVAVPTGFFAGLTQLRELDLAHIFINPDACDTLSMMTQLNVLKLHDTLFPDMPVCNLTSLEIISYDTGWTVTNGTALTKLTCLCMYSDYLTDDLVEHLTSLTSLELGTEESEVVTQLTIDAFHNMTRLKSLCLEGHHNISQNDIDFGLVHLTNLSDIHSSGHI